MVLAMAKQTIASMSIEALVKLRNEIGAALNRKAELLKKELASLGDDFAEVGRIAIHGKRKGKSLKGRKVAPKYRDKAGNQWAGRGAQPVWLREAIAKGAKPEDFLISKMARKAAANPAKKTRRKKKAA
jgi:DNA-binding protein H-NS